MSEEIKTSSGRQSLRWLLENAPSTTEVCKLFAFAWLLADADVLNAFRGVAIRVLLSLAELDKQKQNERTTSTLQHLFILFRLAEDEIKRLESDKTNVPQRPADAAQQSPDPA